MRDDMHHMVPPRFRTAGAVCARQRKPKPHGRADVRSQGNKRSCRRVHAFGKYHSGQKDFEVSVNFTTDRTTNMSQADFKKIVEENRTLKWLDQGRMPIAKAGNGYETRRCYSCVTPPAQVA